MTKITAPVAVPGKVTGVGGLVFTDGVAETDNDAIINYCRDAGYEVGGKRRTRRAEPTPPDPRDLEDEVVGNRLRDAAVDPEPEDFLPPTNAGKENPHGPKVVAPQLHGTENQVVRPGQVHVEDLAAQQKAETKQAEDLLVKQKDVGEALPSFDADTTDDDGNSVSGAQRGPLGLSDPGSVHATATGNSTDTEEPTDPDGTPSADGAELLKGKELDAALDAAGLSKTGNVAEKRARLAEHTGGS